MALITAKTSQVFNLEEISRGTMIRAKMSSWEEAMNGIVDEVSEEKLIVLFASGPGNASGLYEITAADVVAGSWTISWSNDLVTINTYVAAT